jgi:hypothetical protein
MQVKLSLEEASIIYELKQSMYWSVLMKAADQLMKRQEDRVTTFNLQAGDRSLALELARLEGQRSLVASLKALAERDASVNPIK